MIISFYELFFNKVEITPHKKICALLFQMLQVHTFSCVLTALCPEHFNDSLKLY